MDRSRKTFIWRMLVLIALPALVIFLLLWASLVPALREEGTLPVCYYEYGWPLMYLECSDSMEGPDEFNYEWNVTAGAVDLAGFVAAVLAACWIAWRLSRHAWLDRLGAFQLRLSTLLVISLTIGALQWPNLGWHPDGMVTVRLYDSQAREKIPELFARQHPKTEGLRQEYQNRLARDPGFQTTPGFNSGRYPGVDADFYDLEGERTGWPYCFRSRARYAGTDSSWDFGWDTDALLRNLLIDLGIVLAAAVLWQGLIAGSVDRILVKAPETPAASAMPSR